MTMSVPDSNHNDSNHCLYPDIVLVPDQKTKSQITNHVHNPTVPQNTACAVLRCSVARFNSLLPSPIFVVVLLASVTSWLM